MNRREALAALMAMPQVARIGSVPANDDDVIVVECDHKLSMAELEHVSQQLSAVFPKRKVLVLSDGLHLARVPASSR